MEILFTFFWDSSESKARLSAMKENKLVRFEWEDVANEEENFFEFRINIDELTSDLALIITDFAENDEKEDSISSMGFSNQRPEKNTWHIKSCNSSTIAKLNKKHSCYF